MFGYCEEFEIEFGKDVSEFSKKEIETMYGSHKKFKTFNTLIVKHSQYSRYARWFNKNNKYNLIKRDDLTAFVNVEYRNERIVLREDVLRVVDSMINYMDKLLILGIFEGLKGNRFEDFINIRIHDVDFKTHTIHIGSRPMKYIKISKELADIIDRCRTEKVFTSVSGYERYYDNSDYIYKYNTKKSDDDIRNAESIELSHKIRTHYAYAMTNTIIDNVSIVDLQESGKIWFVNQQADEDGCTPLEWACSKKAPQIICNQYGMKFYRKSLFVKNILYDANF